ncbi:MAG: DUF4175 family protein [Deinococcus-Thermus bacterium]|jgi:hypothetical protein|nr:DUF4175 family protein [Deinococcota bacterium]
MPDPLAHIHDAITRLRRLRTIVRLGSAAARVAAIALAGLLGVFLLDWLTDAGRIERAILMLLWLGGLTWSVQRWLVPALLTREADSDLALLIERRQGIDTDLVAAVQFADATRAQFGSPSLRAAVVSYVEEVLPNLDLLEGFDTRPMRPHLAQFGAAVAVWLMLLILAPGHVGAFANRALLAHQPYPTDTRIVEIAEPGAVARAGRPVRFAVRLGGVLPEQAVAQLESVASGLTSEIILQPTDDDAALYTGELRVADADLDYRILAGDTTSRTHRLRVAPAPRIRLSLTITPPPYTGREPITTDARRVAAPQGSAIDVTLHSDQPLGHAALHLEADQVLPLTRTDDGYRPTVLGEPISPLSRSLSLQAEATDEHGLPLRELPAISITMEPDQPPAVQTSAVTRRVLPTGTPRLRIEARDDFGLGRLLLHQTIVPGEGEPVTIATPVAEPAGETDRYDQAVPVPLAGLTLTPGDRVELAVEAIDHRGDLPGQGTRAAPIVLEVIDRQALLDTLLEADQELDQRLNQIIDAQLNVGSGQP